jgi:hypothetical protein
MKLTDFSALTKAAQLNQLYADGVYVGIRQAGNKTVTLYQYDSFYVEVYYSNSRKKLEKIILSDDINILDPFLGQIKITYRNS